MDQPITVLLIEDSEADVRVIQEAIAQDRDLACRVIVADRLSSGLERLRNTGIDLVLLDLMLPDSKGLETLASVRAHAPQMPIVVLTAVDDRTLASQALQQGAQEYLIKAYMHIYQNLLGRSMRYAMERKRTEEQLRSAYAQAERLLFSLPSILIGVNAAGIITHWNAVAEATFGVPAVKAMGRALSQCGLQWDVAKITERMEVAKGQGKSVRLDDLAYRCPDGRDGLLGLTIIPIRGEPQAEESMVLFGADITERRQTEAERARLEQELGRAQKMETIGRFAGGIAHDFQNVLQVILGFAWLLRARHQNKPDVLGDLEEIIHAAENATGLVRQLLAFSRRQALKPTVLELNQTVRNTERLLQQFVGEHVKLDLELSAATLFAKLDPTAFEQILINLCSNARDSMPEGGMLTIRTGPVQADAAFCESRPMAKEREYVRLSVQDTGSGMDPDVAAHIFEPFFTTKQQGKGTGLGLAVVYGLVQQHEGFVEVETAPGRGTAFHLFFPQHQLSRTGPEASTEATAQRSDGGPFPAPSPAGRGAAAAQPPAGQPVKRRLLVVDDESSIRQLCIRILQETYAVTAAASVQAALEELERTPYDVLLTDIKMPGLDGFALIERAAKLQPTLKVLAMSGFVTADTEDRLRDAPLRCKIIRKPFTASALQDMLSQCL